jgi:molybdopterin biosynthesis enzyme
MLRFLGVRHLAVIDALEVEFEPGLNVVTGETGAGKSILVEAVGLLLGGRAAQDLIRTGEDIASREGRTDFIRVRLDHADGRWTARPVGAQISGHLTPQAFAHGLLEVPEERASLAAGEPATVRLWRWPDPA